MGPKVEGEDFEKLITHTVDILTVLDGEGVIQYESPSVERVIGYKPDELEGENVFEYIHPDDRQKTIETFYEVTEADVGYTTGGVELRFRHKDGSWIWFEARGSNQTASVLEGYVISSRDISTRKEYEQQLKRERDRLDRFAGVVSHDLRNPLNVVQGRLELAQEDCESEHLDKMKGSVDRMDELIDDLLALSRESESEPILDAVSIHEISEKCWQNLCTKGATLNIETGENIIADESQLKQVIENLFRNAIEHGGEDITITIGVLDNGFYVEDNGRGIPEDARDYLLEFGFSTETDGTGFGLSIVNEIIENHNWALNVAEGREGGARFELRNVTFA
ncbi:PAS domain-containing sensor histidine kinase [Halogeometricum sp. S1BR25-6]|uniref:histidine kinase n=1 Tax=Halogeometricum salsisoli TaxID=2950536 RepID=A0ABU2G9N7_9EURY|nr:PAS domain-containing sensor histidine kinase [Halogeometricum sp. S1BR25-6]MDS0297526.1 PAS domain-containing sensor histidine kinase [Halogeometricum sp. S1BR25-6]